MLRTLILSASAFALAPFAASAQDADLETGAAAEATMKTKTVAIIDASQVETREEAKLYAASEFSQADLDKDGAVDKGEFIAYASARAPINDPALNIPDEVVETEEGSAETAVEGDVTAAATAEEQFAELSNGDEQISQAELEEKRVAQFDAADEDGDQALDNEERIQFAALTAVKAPQNSL
ncbi:hypothetical protein [Hyphococcus sp.]|uniref:hypothetical protein n=1 Tax=Hyphococcus sp. TaxID=2038636 RepID=UPI003D10132C